GVSAPRGRVVIRGEERVGHVIDPRTGEPVRRAVTAAVWGGEATQGGVGAVNEPVTSAALCDAWSTAALVLGARPAGLPDTFACWVERAGA
ncbi:MAG: FAD:protein FMN transferase, partial [Phycisphaerales bacterium]|nr:FAD:protein FMN transferase [Phycisphaerales bacterium]